MKMETQGNWTATSEDKAMVKKDKSFAELISTDREKRAEEEWSGTFLDYLELLRENPHLPMLAHKRVYEALIDKNDTVLTAEDDPPHRPPVRRRRRQGLHQIQGYLFRHRTGCGPDRALFPCGRPEGRGKPSGLVPDGPCGCREVKPCRPCPSPVRDRSPDDGD